MLWLYLSWLPSFFVGEFNEDIKASAAFSAGVFLAGVVGDTAGGLLTDALPRRTGDLNAARRNVIVLGFGGAFCLLLVMLFVRQTTVAALCLALALSSLEMAEGPIWAVPMDVCPEFAGSYRVPFLVSMAMLALGVGLAFLIRADRPLTMPAGARQLEPVR